MFSDEERKKALADYLKVEVDEIENGYRDDLFETYGEEYLVVDGDEAYELAKEDIINFIDDEGIGGFTPWFQDWILDNACDKSWFDDVQMEDAESYANDIKYEDDYNGECVNRLVAEMKEAGLLSEYDGELVDNGDGLLEPAEDVDMDAKVGEFIDRLVDSWGDAYEWYRDEFGDDGMKEAQKNISLDYDAIVSEAISDDGIAHFIASYDGEEIDLGNGLFAYRVN